MIYALDTNIIAYWLQKNKQIAEHIQGAIKQGDTIIVPPPTYYEIRRGFKHKAAPAKEFAFSLICQSVEIGEMNMAAWEEAADIYGKSRKAGKPIEDTDILIAAFCIVNDYVLVTNNTDHFEGINGLQMVNWVE